VKPITPVQIPTGARRVTYRRGWRTEQLDAAMDDTGLVLTEWEFGAEDLAKMLRGGTVRLWVHTRGKAFQPVHLETTDPEP
jgi:hypothetical protein